MLLVNFICLHFRIQWRACLISHAAVFVATTTGYSGAERKISQRYHFFGTAVFELLQRSSAASTIHNRIGKSRTSAERTGNTMTRWAWQTDAYKSIPQSLLACPRKQAHFSILVVCARLNRSSKHHCHLAQSQKSMRVPKPTYKTAFLS
jgi:hypothetical protein